MGALGIMLMFVREVIYEMLICMFVIKGFTFIFFKSRFVNH